MGNLSFASPKGSGSEKLEGWLSLSTKPFKSRHAGLLELPGFRSAALVTLERF
jgi:hypothetical protein